MALYPLVPPLIRRRGRKPEAMQKAAALYRLGERICAHINEQMQSDGDETWRMFPYGLVAHRLSAGLRDVEAILAELGGGGNGITVVKRESARLPSP
jgi:hypothetical protein